MFLPLGKADRSREGVVAAMVTAVMATAVVVVAARCHLPASPIRYTRIHRNALAYAERAAAAKQASQASQRQQQQQQQLSVGCAVY